MAHQWKTYALRNCFKKLKSTYVNATAERDTNVQSLDSPIAGATSNSVMSTSTEQHDH
jgi:hypothetical protein